MEIVGCIVKFHISGVKMKYIYIIFDESKRETNSTF